MLTRPPLRQQERPAIISCSMMIDRLRMTITVMMKVMDTLTRREMRAIRQSVANLQDVRRHLGMTVMIYLTEQMGCQGIQMMGQIVIQRQLNM